MQNILFRAGRVVVPDGFRECLTVSALGKKFGACTKKVCRHFNILSDFKNFFAKVLEGGVGEIFF